MKIINYVLIVICLTAQACHNDKMFFAEVNDKDMRMQVAQLKEDTNDPSIISYKVRLIPDKGITDKQTIEDKRAMIFHMDSCFYINTPINKTYAALVQPIANGVGNSYEYLIEFELNKDDLDKHPDFVYQDRYITHQTYKLKLNRQ